MIANPSPYYTWSQKVDGSYRILASPTPDPILTVSNYTPDYINPSTNTRISILILISSSIS